MKRATVSETKNHLSRYLDLVKQGETVLITDRGRPVARLEPAQGGGSLDAEDWLADLERRGIVKRGRGKLPKDFFDRPLPKPKGGGKVAVDALLREREEGW